MVTSVSLTAATVAGPLSGAEMCTRYDRTHTWLRPRALTWVAVYRESFAAAANGSRCYDCVTGPSIASRRRKAEVTALRVLLRMTSDGVGCCCNSRR